MPQTLSKPQPDQQTNTQNKKYPWESTSKKGTFLALNPHKQPYNTKPNHRLPKSITEYEQVTDYILDNLYPCHCPTCNIKLTKRLPTRPYAIRCTNCHYLTSRFSYTPLHHSKLPHWMFGWLVQESLERSPQVVSNTEIRKRLGISKNSATRLKRRFQLFASDQLPKLKKLMYDQLEEEWKETNFPRSEKEDITEIVKEKNVVHADTAVLWSATQRANKGRKRHKHSGLTASIYLSDKVKEGKQIGTLIQTIGFKKGAAFFEAIHSNKASELMPLLNKQVPKDVGLFTDEGYKWYYRINKNHRMINHSARSKDKRYKWAKNRWSKNGVHNQVAEGLQRSIKWQFTAGYSYVSPEYAPLYLNEFSFLKSVQYYGFEKLVGGGGSVGVEGKSELMISGDDATVKPTAERQMRPQKVDGFVGIESQK